MGTRANQDIKSADPEVINEYLGSSFKHMANYGEKVYRPFMQVCPSCLHCKDMSLCKWPCCRPNFRDCEEGML